MDLGKYRLDSRDDLSQKILVFEMRYLSVTGDDATGHFTSLQCSRESTSQNITAYRQKEMIRSSPKISSTLPVEKLCLT